MTHVQYLLFGALILAIAVLTWILMTRKERSRRQLLAKTAIVLHRTENDKRVRHILRTSTTFGEHLADTNEDFEGQTYMTGYDVVEIYDDMAVKLRSGDLDMQMVLEEQGSEISILFGATKEIAARVRERTDRKNFGRAFEWLEEQADHHREAWFDETSSSI